MHILLPFLDAVQAALQDAPVGREIPWIVFVILGLYLAVVIGWYVVFEYRQRRRLVIGPLPFNVDYELKQLAERQRRSPRQQALLLIERALERREPRLVIRPLPFNVDYELKRLAERERRSRGQQALALIEEALEARARARYGRAGGYAERQAG